MGERARSNPPLTAGRTFEAAARLGSFQLAADELHVTPAAVSHQVKRLEGYLGIALFTRHNRAVVLTEAGASLAQQLRGHFVALERLLQPPGARMADVVRVTAMPSLAAKWLARRLPGFHQECPDIEVRLSDDDAPTNFADGRFDLALRYGRGPYPGLTALPWMEAPLLAVRNKAVAEQDSAEILAQGPLLHDSTPLLPGSPPGWPEWLAGAGLAEIDARAGLRYSSIYITLEAARAGAGIALAPEPLVRDDLEAGNLHPTSSFVLDSPYRFWIVHPAGAAPGPAARRFMDWLLREGAS